MKRKLISLLLAFSLLVSVLAVLPAISVGAVTPGATNPTGYDYVISTKDELVAFATAVNTGAKIKANSGANKDKEIDAFSAKALLNNDIVFNEGYSYSIDYDTSLVKVVNGENAYYLGTGIKGAGGGNTQFDSTPSVNNTWYTLAGGTYTTEGAVDPTALEVGALEVFTPIGTTANPFLGAFNGNGFAVVGMYVNNTDYAGLIGLAGVKYIQGSANYGEDGTTVTSYNGVTYAASITSVTVKDSFIKSTHSAGAVTGFINANLDGHSSTSDAHDHGLHPNCKVSAGATVTFNDNNNVNTCIVGASNVGGVVGHIFWTDHYIKANAAASSERKYGTVGVYRLTNTGDILASGTNVAGLIGYGQRVTFKDNNAVYRNDGKVSSVLNDYVAGIVGTMGDGAFEGIYINTGDIFGKNNVGGIVASSNRGMNYGLNTGNITAQGNVGGIAGYLGDNNKGLVACANLGNVTGDNDGVGGLVGQARVGGNGISFTACYNMGQVVSRFKSVNARAIVGLNHTSGLFQSANGVYSVELKHKNSENQEAVMPLFPDVFSTEANASKITNSAILTKADDFTNGALFALLNSIGAYFEQPIEGAPVPKRNGGRMTTALEGEGTKENPYLIYNAADLAEFRDRVNNGSYRLDAETVIYDTNYSHAKLMSDITLNAGYKFEFSGDTSKYTVKVTDPSGNVAYVSRSNAWTADAAGTNSTLPEGFVKPTSWTPIGNSTAYAYKGTFDGNGYTISGLFIGSAADNQGLFGIVGTDAKSELCIQNVNVADSCVVGKGSVGALIGIVITNVGDTSSTSARCDHTSGVCARGYEVLGINSSNNYNYSDFECAYNTGNRIRGLKIDNCNVSSSVVAGSGSYVGGIIGGKDSSNTRKRHEFSGIDESGNAYTGYYMNRSYSVISLTNCTNGATVIGNGCVGGISGGFTFGSLQYLTNKGDVYSTEDKAAGLIATIDNHATNNKYNANYGNVTGTKNVGGCYIASNRALSYLFNAGKITATADAAAAGGIVAAPGADCGSISYSANVGEVVSTNNGYAGGIIGYRGANNVTLTGCYNAGVVTASKGVADFANMANSTLKITLTNCYTATEYASAVVIDGSAANISGTAGKVTAAEVADGTLLGKLTTTHYGQSVSMKYPVPAFKAALAGTDVTLRDGILLNFYVDVSTHLASGVTNAELVTVAGKQYYKVTVEVDAKAMGDVQSVTVAGVALKSSVEEYAAGILGGDYTAETKAMVQAMLSYGAAAQNYFDYDANNLVGTPVTSTDALAGAEAPEVSVADEAKIFLGASLVLDGTMKLNVYFKGNVEVTVDGAAAKVTNKEKYCFAEIAVTPENIDKVFEIVAGDTVVKYSPLNYLKNSVEDADLAEMVASIYAYSVAAEAYIASLKFEYPVSSITPLNGTIKHNGAVTVYEEGDGKRGALISLEGIGYNTVTITSGKNGFDFTYLADDLVAGKAPVYSKGYYTLFTRRTDDTVTLEVPADAKYLYLTYDDGATNYLPTSIVFENRDVVDPLTALQKAETEKYEYPMSAIEMDAGSIYKTEGKYIIKTDSKGTYHVAFIDITDCAYDAVRIGVNPYNKEAGYAFLTEMPTLNEKVSYSEGYTDLVWIWTNEKNVDNGQVHDSVIQIPDDANVLVVYYLDNVEVPDYWAPGYVVFEDTYFDELGDETLEEFEYPMDKFVPSIGTINYGSSEKATHLFVGNTDYKVTIINITDTVFNKVSFTIADDHPDPWIGWAFLTERPVLHERVSYAEGYFTFKTSTVDCSAEIPVDAKYLAVYYMDPPSEVNPTGLYHPETITFGYGETTNKTYASLTDASLSEYSFPMDQLTHTTNGAIRFDIDTNKHKFLPYTENGKNCSISLINITDTVFNTVDLGLTESFGWVGYTFLTEHPALGVVASYATGYDTFEWADKDVNSIEIPEDATYLVVWYADSATDFYYPESITFKK